MLVNFPLQTTLFQKSSRLVYCTVQNALSLPHITCHNCFSLAGDFQEVHTESVTVEEGQDLSLQCDFTGDHESVFTWSDPRGFLIFLKSDRGKCQNLLPGYFPFDRRGVSHRWSFLSPTYCKI